MKKRIMFYLLFLGILLCGYFSFSEPIESKANIYGKWQDTDEDGHQEIRCTWFAWESAYNNMGIQLPNFGNAKDWLIAANNAGYSTGTTAQANSIAVWDGGTFGHVSYVKTVSGATMVVDEGGRTDLDHTSSQGVAYSQSAPSTVGSDRWGQKLIGFIYLGKSPENLPSGVTFDDEGVTNLTDTNATISTWINNTGSITERGFYIGMSDEYQNKVVVGTQQVEWTRFREEYNIADYYGELTPGVRYTYVFYVKKGDKEHHSSVGHFTTSGSSHIMFDTYGLNNISEDSAYISTWFSNPKEYKISSLGFLIGEKFKSLKKVEVYSDVEWTRAETKCEIKDYAGGLKASTNYVARFYVAIGSQIYYSDYICFFTTPPTVTFDNGDVFNLTDRNATITTWVNNAGCITERGFYIGMSDEYQNKVVVETQQVEWTRFREEYNIADYYGELTPGIRYTYVFYVKKGDKEYRSSVGHFTTSGSADIMFDTYGLNNISENSANISTWFSNSNGYTISSYGFLIGEDFKSLEKAEVFRDIRWTRAETKCEIKDYVVELKPSTNYVVRFYMTIGSQTYYSDYIVFSTASSVNDIEKEHIWNDGIVTKEATCTEEGVKTYTCTCCGEKKEETIVATGHMGDYVTNSNGTHSRKCKYCGETEVFNCSYGTRVTEPTCKKRGYTTYTCKNCGYSYKADFVDCIEHSFTNYVSDNNATILTDGTKTAYCDYGCGTADTVIDEGSALGTGEPGIENTGNDDLEKPEPEPNKKPIVSKVRSFRAKAGKKKLTLTWKKLSGAVGYQIQVSTRKNFKGAKKIFISRSKKTYTKKSLKVKKKYYIRIRAYKTYKDANKKTRKVYGKWSAIKRIKIKK